MRNIVIFLCISLFISCKNKSIKKLENGMYRAWLTVQDDQELPFVFEVKNDSNLVIYNAEEEIIVDEITYINDSIKIQTPVFEGYIIAKISNNELTGSFIKESYDRIVPF
jgi:hypothetical protein